MSQKTPQKKVKMGYFDKYLCIMVGIVIIHPRSIVGWCAICMYTVVDISFLYKHHPTSFCLYNQL